MHFFKVLSMSAIVAAGLLAAGQRADAAQVSVSIGPAPVCPYGYYEAPPYRCAPDGYYGPEWFSGGVFIGAGPWHRDRFYGEVDHHYDYRHGYHGAFPERGAQPAEHRREFHGNARHDTRGREVSRDRRP